ncbi:MAG: hypothetical protein WAT61_09475, partial [Flavobacteriales bacterium]
GLATYDDVHQYIVKHKLCTFGGLTPGSTISAQLGDFVRKGDSRIRRLKKQEGGGFFYYLAEYESDIASDVLAGAESANTAKGNDRTKAKSNGKAPTYHERDLHKLLSSYLKTTGVFSKTIFHEQSLNSADGNQTWTHPDVVGISLLKLQTKESEEFLRAVDPIQRFKLNSYEIKKEINSDSELKKAYFQAVSNSSWANFGYLVAFEISDGLKDEIERLGQAFGIGVIKLDAYPYLSKVVHPARYRGLDFKTIDKLCKVNPEFGNFIEQAEKLLVADVKFRKATEKELTEFCDTVFSTDAEIERYCKEKNIPWEELDVAVFPLSASIAPLTS